MFEVATEATISAPAARVWDVLTDFAAYSSWNPVITRVAVDLREGARGKASFAVSSSRSLTIPILIESVAPRVELAWSGGPRWLFHGTHYFRLREQPCGATHVAHGELFEGAAVRLTHGLMRSRVVPVYQSLTDALKRRCEARA
jgi:hypothetical protein